MVISSVAIAVLSGLTLARVASFPLRCPEPSDVNYLDFCKLFHVTVR